MNSTNLRELQGRKVTIWSYAGSGSYKDQGTFQYCDGQFIRITDKDGREMYFPIGSVRLVVPDPQT